MVNKPMIGVAAVVLVVGWASRTTFTGATPCPPPSLRRVPPPPAAGTEPAIEHPLPSSAVTRPRRCPRLNDSDPAMKDALSALVGANAMQYVVPEDIVRHFVVTIDNLPRQKAPAAKRPDRGGAGSVPGRRATRCTPRSIRRISQRYDPMVNVVRQLDMQRVADTYFHFYPLVPERLPEPRIPERLFQRPAGAGDRFVARDAASPAVPSSSRGPNVLYTFADPKLEALPAGQKLLLRMGPDNAAVIKAKLKELRAIITAAPPQALSLDIDQLNGGWHEQYDGSGGLAVGKTAAPNQWLVIGASSLGTVFEWYDFYIYGLLATILTTQFFSGVNEVTGFIFALATFAAGFAVRPFGALVFGRLGDLVGRKHTFLITMSIMGGATFLVGLLPSYATAGLFAPIALVLLRLLQGLALGGEYGGAATYVAEHAPRRQARALHELDPDHRDARIVRGAARGHRYAHWNGRGCLQGLGLAHSVPGLAAAADRLALDPHEARREPGVHEHEAQRAPPRRRRSRRPSAAGAI